MSSILWNSPFIHKYFFDYSLKPFKMQTQAIEKV